MFRDSFSTSAMPYLDIYYHPDTPTVENIKTDSIADYFVHIIDVSAQQDVLMEIDITEPANGIGYFMQGSDNVHFTESDIDLSDRGLGEENGQLPIQQGQPNSNNSNSNNPYV
jgi:GH25 family lysozyme M1 (1,4-beta-N-acetylmuramidase)